MENSTPVNVNDRIGAFFTDPLVGLYFAVYHDMPRFDVPSLDHVGQIMNRIPNTNYYLVDIYTNKELTSYSRSKIVYIDELKEYHIYRTLEQFNDGLYNKYF
jgi:hypothetical protein